MYAFIAVTERLRSSYLAQVNKNNNADSGSPRVTRQSRRLGSATQTSGSRAPRGRGAPPKGRGRGRQNPPRAARKVNEQVVGIVSMESPEPAPKPSTSSDPKPGTSKEPQPSTSMHTPVARRTRSQQEAADLELAKHEQIREEQRAGTCNFPGRRHNSPS